MKILLRTIPEDIKQMIEVHKKEFSDINVNTDAVLSIIRRHADFEVTNDLNQRRIETLDKTVFDLESRLNDVTMLLERFTQLKYALTLAEENIQTFLSNEFKEKEDIDETP